MRGTELHGTLELGQSEALFTEQVSYHKWGLLFPVE